MYRTTEGFHTFTVFKRLTKDEADELFRDFKRYEHETGEIDIFPTDKSKKNIRVIYTSGNIGIKWLLRFCNISSDFKMYFIEATINPKVLTGVKGYLSAANMEHMEDMVEKFNHEAMKISLILRGFCMYRLNRIDYCVNFHLRDLGINCDPMLVMMLLKRSNIPTHYKEREVYSDISHRWISDPASHYLKSGSVTINCYSKYMELQRQSQERTDRGLPPINPQIMEDAHDLIRFEVQCKYTKLYSILQDYRELKKKMNVRYREIWNEIMKHSLFSPNNSELSEKELHLKEEHDRKYRNELLEESHKYRLSNEIKFMLSDDTYRKILHNYFGRVVMGGDYYTLEHARKIIKSQNFRQSKEDKMIWVLELINEKRGVSKAKESLPKEKLDGFNRILRALVDERINPVTIPRGYGVNYIPNLYEAYTNKVINNKIDERRRVVRLDEHFKNRKKRK